MAGYLGASPVPQTIQKKQSFTATASQTTFTTTGYTDGQFINVYLNGVRLINGTDYQATNGSDIVLTTGASASDVLDFETFNEFTLVDQTLETPTFRTSATLKNDTHEDTDGGRESTLIFKGEQSGGEISTLAEIEASHDGTADDQKGDLIFRTNDGSDGTSPTEAARIDSDRNFLVGQTAQATNATGFSARANSLSHFCRDTSSTGSGVLLLNKKTGNGHVLVIQKDDSTVGTIGVNGNDNIQIFSSAADHAGLEFATHLIAPLEAGAASDGTIDLGADSARFKDLYLSGGIYIGGTGAANYLTDYEEGTFTPSFTSGVASGSHNHQFGFYTKVGRVVHFELDIQASTTANGDIIKIDSLPFTSASTTRLYANAQINYQASFLSASDTGSVSLHISSGSTTIAFYTSPGGTFNGTDANNINARIIISGRYFAA